MEKSLERQEHPQINEVVRPFFSEFIKLVEETSILSFITRDAELQDSSVDSLTSFEKKCDEGIVQFAKKGLEDEANLLLSLQYQSESMRSELLMYLAMKEEEWEKAWVYLVDAQEFIEDSMHAHRISKYTNAVDYARKLSWIETLLFPPQTFLSLGMQAKSQICNLCEKGYDSCEHIEGRASAGKLCTWRASEIEFQEASIVDVPHDKRCRVIHFGDKGKMRNKMTWKLEDIK